MRSPPVNGLRLEGDPTDGESAHSPNRKQLDRRALLSLYARLMQREESARNISEVDYHSNFESGSSNHEDKDAQRLKGTVAGESELHELSSQRNRPRSRDERSLARKLLGESEISG